MFPGWCRLHISFCKRCYRKFWCWRRKVLSIILWQYIWWRKCIQESKQVFNSSRFEAVNSVLAHLHGSITPESSFPKICEFFEKEQNIIKYFSGYVTKTLYCRLKKSAEHRSHSNIKYLSILLAGRDSSDYLTKDGNFINVKKRSNLWKAGKLLLTFSIFSLFLRTFSGLIFQTRK